MALERIIYVKHTLSETTVLGGLTMAPNTYYLVEDEPAQQSFYNDLTVKSMIFSATFIINNGEVDLAAQAGYDWLVGNIPKDVTPTAPKNEYELKPLGKVCKSFMANEKAAGITLSQQSGSSFTYSSNLIPAVGDRIYQNDFENWDKITNVNTQSSKLNVLYGDVSAQYGFLAKKTEIYYELPTNETYYYLWGARVKTINEGFFDTITLEIYDTYGALGAGPMYEVKDYDELWVSQINHGYNIPSPDGAPGKIPGSFTLGADYYCTHTASQKVTVLLDYIITNKD